MINQQEVQEIVRETRKISLPHWGNIESSSKSDSPSDLVTEIDKNIEGFLKEKLHELYPTIPFVGEEIGGDRDQETFWLCDPIDGTVHFVRGLPFCTTMLCLIENGTVVFSCIYHFVTDDMYFAIRGNGAYKNNTPIYVSDSSLKGAYIGLECNETIEGMTAIRHSIESNKCAIVRTINCGWEFSMVAEGKLDARIQINPWGDIYDFAPGSLLVEEAGGIVKNINSQTYDYRNLNFVATNKQIYSDIKSLNIL
jgi:myo-inositol-1(or 4)-monophosphatase